MKTKERMAMDAGPTVVRVKVPRYEPMGDATPIDTNTPLLQFFKWQLLFKRLHIKTW